MVGLGSMGKYHIKKFTALGFEIAGGVDTDPKAIEQAKVRYSIPWTGSRISDFHGEVDAVSIAVPDSMHRDCYLEADRIGKPLFLEKPLTRSLADAEYLNTNIKSPCMVNFSKRNISALFVLKQMLDECQLDETYYKVRNPDIVLKPDGKQYRGISRNQICIGIACDTRNVVCFELGNGKPTKSAVKDRMGPHIIKGTTLIHDMEKAHGSLVSDLELKSIIYNSKLIKSAGHREPAESR